MKKSVLNAGFFDQSYHIPCIIVDPRPIADATRGTVVEAFTEHVDLMPTILECVLGQGTAEIPRQCDGRSLLPFLTGATPAFWRSHVCWEYDLRWGGFGRLELAEGEEPTPLDAMSLSVFRDATHKSVPLPPSLWPSLAYPSISIRVFDADVRTF